MASTPTTTHIYRVERGAWGTLCGLLPQVDFWHRLDIPILYVDQPEAVGATCAKCRAEMARRALDNTQH